MFVTSGSVIPMLAAGTANKLYGIFNKKRGHADSRCITDYLRSAAFNFDIPREPEIVFENFGAVPLTKLA